MSIKEVLAHQQSSGNLLLIRQGLFFRGYNESASLLSKAMGYMIKSKDIKSCGCKVYYVGFPYSKGVEFLGVVIKNGALLSGKRIKSGLYSTIESHNIRADANKKISDADLSNFRDSINSYWGLMRHHSSYNLRCRSAKRISDVLLHRLVNKRDYASYCKINIKKKRRIKYIDLHLED